MTLATRRKRIGLRTRFAVLQAGGFRCFYCGRPPGPDVVLQVDHRVPVAAGGTNDRSNLVASCTACNNGKGDRPLAECFDFSHAGPFRLMPLENGDSVMWCLACTRATHVLAIGGQYEVLA